MMKAIWLSGTCLAVLLCSSIASAQESSLASDPKETKPLKEGASIPSVSVKTGEGRLVPIALLHRDQPIVLVFFRGSWCPFCTRHTQELIEAYPKIKAQGAEMVGISPDTPEKSKANRTENSIPFPILSDPDVAAARAFGLAFQVDDETLQRYEKFGIDLEEASGSQHHALPVPAVYIVDKTGKIVFAHSNPDYRERLDTETIISELEKLE